MRKDDYLQDLTFVRYLWSVASDQANQPYPFCMASVLGFQDAIELFLRVAAEHLNVPIGENEPFLSYMGSVDAAVKKTHPSGLVQTEAMKRVNQVRKGLKHHATWPRTEQIRNLRSKVEDFFEDNTPRVFDGTRFDEISLVSLIAHVEAKAALLEAERLMQIGDTKAAVEQIALSFDRAITAFHESHMPWNDRSSAYFLGRQLPFWATHDLGKLDRNLKTFAESVDEQLKAIRGALSMLTLGLDYGRYARFKALTPRIWRSSLEGIKFTHAREDAPSLNDCRSCFDFALESILRLQQIEPGAPSPV